MSEDVEKLTFTGGDFKFNIAYNEYSKRFDESEIEEEKVKLNEIITKLFEKEIDYPEFYEIIKQETDPRYRYHRSKIGSSRKFAYRREQQKIDRIKRHK